ASTWPGGHVVVRSPACRPAAPVPHALRCAVDQLLQLPAPTRLQAALRALPCRCAIARGVDRCGCADTRTWWCWWWPPSWIQPRASGAPRR
ncbi:hypothetical protein, partial [Xanthomonas euvesicatoria]|uniref:hypothetical protein n=1 Tax=Xanthomonas euvesicatoria TaxID=456327 RepID=UPI001E3EBCB8